MDLKELFELQGTLNAKVGFDHERFAKYLNNDDPQPLHLVEAGQWLDNFIKATHSELEELRNCTYWKHWCAEAQRGDRYMLKSVSSAQKEVIDLLHFWISLAQATGLTAEMVEAEYRRKLDINIKRQEDGYSIQEKDRAWVLWIKHKMTGTLPVVDEEDLHAISFEDLSGSTQRYLIDWVRRIGL